jgi:cell division protein FtsB
VTEPDLIDDEFSERLADLLAQVKQLPADRLEQLEREIEELKRRRESSNPP